MRILTVRQPWAWAIFHGGKDVENRTRNVAGAYRGPVAIHAGLSDDRSAEAAWVTDEWSRWWAQNGTPGGQRGHIIGVVDLTDAHNQYCDTDAHPICSEWAEFGVWHLVLGNPRPLREPISFKGALGLRELPDDVAALVAERSAR